MFDFFRIQSIQTDSADQEPGPGEPQSLIEF
jgi:hypothetical protein